MANLISFDEQNKVFHLHNDKISYIFSVVEGGLLNHLYYGKRINEYHGEMNYPRIDRGFSGNLPGSLDRTFSPDTLMQEYSTSGICDYRTPAVIVRQENGSRASRFEYQGYRIEAGKPKLKGLPATYVESDDEAETLYVTLKDQVSDVEVTLLYTIYRDRAVIARSAQVKNNGDAAVYLDKVASMQIDLPNQPLDVVSFPGAHANERDMERAHLNRGVRKYESRRGTTSHQMNNFVALCSPNTDEMNGEVYGFDLVYSGNFAIEVERDQIQQTRVTCGINDYNFAWKLASNEEFQTPESLIVYSDEGFNGMSQTFHHLIQERVVRGKYRDQERPIVVNNWEATFMDFTEEKLTPIVDEAQKLGIEMFVLDDGWFGHRDDDNSSLGDWYVDQKKFPKGLKHFADYVHDKGLKFGLWFEPEMISIDSDLYREHPDYMMAVPGRKPSPSRNQYLLDLTRKDVRDNIIGQVEKILRENDVDYVKWDMNRHLSDVYSLKLPADQEGEVYHRYILGAYEMVDQITSDFPEILFEGCSGGGGRFDTGWAYYMPQSWVSDNTDAVARQRIQYATSYVYPTSTMTAHVSVSPNQQTGRQTSFETRGNCAMSGVFGYELDLTRMSDDEKAMVTKQVAEYKEVRHLVQFGDFYRLKSPYTSNECAWMFVSPDKKDVLVKQFQTMADAQALSTITKLVGLDPQKHYQNVETKEIFGGDELMNVGFFNPFYHHDYASSSYRFKAID